MTELTVAIKAMNAFLDAHQLHTVATSLIADKARTIELVQKELEEQPKRVESVAKMFSQMATHIAEVAPNTVDEFAEIRKNVMIAVNKLAPGDECAMLQVNRALSNARERRDAVSIRDALACIEGALPSIANPAERQALQYIADGLRVILRR